MRSTSARRAWGWPAWFLLISGPLACGPPPKSALPEPEYEEAELPEWEQPQRAPSEFDAALLDGEAVPEPQEPGDADGEEQGLEPSVDSAGPASEDSKETETTEPAAPAQSATADELPPEGEAAGKTENGGQPGQAGSIPRAGE